MKLKSKIMKTKKKLKEWKSKELKFKQKTSSIKIDNWNLKKENLQKKNENHKKKIKKLWKTQFFSISWKENNSNFLLKWFSKKNLRKKNVWTNWIVVFSICVGNVKIM